MIVEMIFNVLPNQRTCPCILSRNVGAMFLDLEQRFRALSNVETLLHHVFRFSLFTPKKTLHNMDNQEKTVYDAAKLITLKRLYKYYKRIRIQYSVRDLTHTHTHTSNDRTKSQTEINSARVGREKRFKVIDESI